MRKDIRRIPGDVLTANRAFRYFGKAYFKGDEFPAGEFDRWRIDQLMRNGFLKVTSNVSQVSNSVAVPETIAEMEKADLPAKKLNVDDMDVTSSARVLVEEYGLEDDIQYIEGTGKDGKITKSDVESYIGSLDDEDEDEE